MRGIRCTAGDFWTVALTCYGEARGEGVSGIAAVAWVIRNRHEHHTRWRGLSLTAICLAPWQFSCWNNNDPNLSKLRKVSLDDEDFVDCLRVVLDVLGGVTDSPVGLATHYFNPHVVDTPRWAEGQTPVAHIGQHAFYEDIA